jgi:mycothione reductase
MSPKGVQDYDVIVVGSGSGMTVVENALNEGLRVALIEGGPVGGTCLNVGCIPTKLLVFPADRIAEIQESAKLGVKARIEAIDFAGIMERMRRSVQRDHDQLREGLRGTWQLDFYETMAHFVGPYTLQVGDVRIRGKKIFLANGARPLMPPIRGLDQLSLLNNETVLQLTALPASMAIIGGGYMACEFAHFFAAMGTRVTILQRNKHLVPEEEPEISTMLKNKLSERMEVHTGTEVNAVGRQEDGYVLTAKDVAEGGERTFSAEQVLLAAGRRSNADLLQVDAAGIATDERGYVVVNEFLGTNIKNIWAFGDITGRHMFRHVANEESFYAWHNSQHRHGAAVPYDAIPHAVFTYPQIASVGLTEREARRGHRVLVGLTPYTSVAMGEAMLEQDGFAKAVVEESTGRILGFHIIGAQASILIQEVINAMAAGGQINTIGGALHIHPALSELVVRALYNVHDHTAHEHGSHEGS